MNGRIWVVEILVFGEWEGTSLLGTREDARKEAQFLRDVWCETRIRQYIRWSE